MTPDVNILVAAFRSDHPHHQPARAWLEGAVTEAGSGTLLRLQPMVIASFLRLVTHPKIFVQPTPIEAALEFVDALLSAPGVEQPHIGAEWESLRKLCSERSLKANDLPDAWLAATVLHQGEHLVTFDADFRKLLPRGRYTRLKAQPA
ncbi:TA system VapC family ribonuclease toxin [Burkholderia stagnalis]|uniref:Ribonuclease VapC n=1 Tax=Burkholderia stagnalis TaxID=1503054 RepID=A0ABX9YEC5_9BURK|nr:TA system VapC family ribonuclease toxin [Burkholderia stagnalis]RQQ47592.1 PIN domain-containing protein [Burkholderia stagnalis]RQQ59317.1 PIN domain-containing protein [Burkholderia stagnalis]RQQ59795.1 PIN domain-containing protein [Burkholderia stagnalis]RQQ74138.1 PIN domain-containing protein [Burkholderia stagnalis]RQQ79884.1 PIN domain-containing protein [Burkholderia stagnalis]